MANEFITRKGFISLDDSTVSGSLFVSGTIEATQTAVLEGLENAALDTDKFLVATTDGTVKFRTGAEVLSDIGAGSSTLNGVPGEIAFFDANTQITGSSFLTALTGSTKGIDLDGFYYSSKTDGSQGAKFIAIENETSASVTKQNLMNFGIDSGAFHWIGYSGSYGGGSTEVGRFAIDKGFTNHYRLGTANFGRAAKTNTFYVWPETTFFNGVNMEGHLTITGSLTVSGSNTFRNIGPAYFTEGNVGIGTTSPAHNLHVDGDTLVFTQTGQTYTDGSTGLTGIGIRNTGTSAAYNAFGIETGQGSIFQVRNNGHVIIGRGGIDSLDSYLILNGGSGPSGEAFLSLQRNSVQQFLLNTTAGETQIRNTGNLPLYFYTNDSIRMAVAANGNIGMGTTSPNYKLDVAGNAAVVDSLYIFKEDPNNNSTADSSLMLQSKGTLNSAVTSSEWYLGTLAEDVFTKTGDSKFRIIKNHHDGAGNVIEALQLDSTGSLKLPAYGQGNFTANSVYRLAVDANGNVIEESLGDGSINGLGASRYIARWTDTDSLTTSSLYEDASGNVGIGTTSPSYPLHVIGNTNIDGNIYINEYILHNSDTNTNIRMLGDSIRFNAGAVEFLRFVEDDTQDQFIVNEGSVDVDFRVKGNGDVNLIRTDAANDKVGIGTGTPTHKLQVEGSADVVNIAGSGSTANTSIFSVDGNNGRLFEVSDDLSDSLFSVNTIAGLPVLEVFADNRIVAGAYNQNDLVISGSRVGIGTDSSQHKLQVASPSSTSVVLGVSYSPSNINNFFETGISANDGYLNLRNSGVQTTVHIDSDGISFFNGGNVGIGTTAPGAKLDVVGSIGVTSGDTFGFDSYNGSIYMATSGRGLLGKFGGNGYARNLIKSDGSATVHIGDNTSLISRILLDAGSASTNGYISLQTKQSERVRITQDGNVGIGTTSPTTILNVYDSTATAGISIQGGNAYSSDLNLGDTDDINIGRIKYDHTNDSMQFQVNNSERVRITSTGNVGIGTTNPSNKLVVDSGTTNVAAAFQSTDTEIWINLRDGDSGTTNTSYGVLIGHQLSTGELLKVADSSVTTRFLVTTSGNVGIGTATPTEKLTVEGNISASGDIDASRATFSSTVETGNLTVAGNGTVQGDLVVTGKVTAEEFHTEFVSASIIFQSGSTQFGNSADDNHIFTGNVGIGITGPTQKLDVSGYARATSGFVGSANLKLFGDNTSTEFIQVNTNGTVQMTAYGAGYLKTDAAGDITVDNSTFLTAEADTLATVTGRGNVTSTAMRVEAAATGLGGYMSVGNSTEAAGNYSAYFFGNTATDDGYFKGGIAYETISSAYGRGDIHFLQNNTTSNGKATIADSVMTILNDGNVGIGTTSPNRGLTINRSNEFAALNIIKSNSTNQIVYLGTDQSGPGDGGILQLYDAAVEKVRLYTAGNSFFTGGNVGIGTTSPANKLSVIGAVNASSILVSATNTTFSEGTGATNGQIYFDPVRSNRSLSVTTQQLSAGDDIDGVAFNVFYTNTGNPVDLLFRNGGNNNLCVKGNGNVGIGTTSPGEKLDVIGNISTSNDIYIGNDIVSTGEMYIKTGTNLRLQGNIITFSNAAGSTEYSRFDSSGRLGIGTTVPSRILTVSAPTGDTLLRTNAVTGSYAGLELTENNSTTSGEYWQINKVPTSHRLQFWNGSERLTVLSGGNVGIGTTAPLRKLHVGGDIELSGAIYGQTTDHTYLEIANSGYHHRFFTRTDGGVASERFTIQGGAVTGNTYFQNTNVGIGTTSPDALLEISGNAGADPGPISNPTTFRITDAGNAATGAGDTTNPWGRIQFYSEDSSSGGPSVQAQIASIYGNIYSSSSHLAFYTQAVPSTGIVERMRILGNGGVSVGTTAATGLFNVQGTSYFADDIILRDGSVSSGDTLVRIYDSSDDGVIDVYQNNSVTARINGNGASYFNGGNVGIGTTAPNSKLEVVNSGNAAMTVRQSLAAANSRYSQVILTHGTTSFGANDKSYQLVSNGLSSGEADFAVQYWNGSTYAERMRITSAGNVGIGTSSPGNYKLYVNGGQFGTLLRGGDLGTGSDVVRMIKSNGSVAMLVRGDGNVGIGTTAPAAHLHVNGASIIADGNTTIDPDSSDYSVVAGAINDGGGWGVNSGIGGRAAGTGDTWAIGHNGASLYFGIGDGANVNSLGTFMRADPDRSVALDVYGSGNITGTAAYNLQVDSSGNIIETAAAPTSAVGGSGVAEEVAVWSSSANVSGSQAFTWNGDVLFIDGVMEAREKSFNIKHPTKENKRLIYGVLEGPEHGVYVRGKIESNVIELPEEWVGLVDKDSITVQLTSIGSHQNLYVSDIKDNKIFIKNGNTFSSKIKAFYYVQGTRKDVKPLVTERDA